MDVSIAEQRLGVTLDWVYEVYEFHCGLPGRAAIAAVFSWFESLRLTLCARRFRGCGAGMKALLAAECAQSTMEAQHAIAKMRPWGAVDAPDVIYDACADPARVVMSAASLVVQFGRQLQLADGPCDADSRHPSQWPLLYPAHRAPAEGCHPARLPVPHLGTEVSLPGSVQSVRAFRDISAHFAPGRPLGVAQAISLLRETRFGLDTASLQWLVNLGAGDGECHPGAHYDPANCLAFDSSGFRSVMVEGNPESFRALQQRADSSASWQQGVGDHTAFHPRHRLVQAFVAPWNVVETIAPLLPTSEPALLKLDVDNADCLLLRSLLTVFSPLLLYAEINPLYPPPMVFRPAFEASSNIELGEGGRFKRLARSHTAGCSLAAMIEDANLYRRARANVAGEAVAGSRQGLAGSEASWQRLQYAGAKRPGHLRYEVLHVEFANALFAREDVAEVLRGVVGNASTSTLWLSDVEAKWRAGYLCLPLSRHMYRREWEARCDVRALADPGTAALERLEWARRWLEALDAAEAAAPAAGYELYLSSKL